MPLQPGLRPDYGPRASRQRIGTNRTPLEDRALRLPGLRPVATPVDFYHRPPQPVGNNLERIASALGSLGNSFGALNGLVQKNKEENEESVEAQVNAKLATMSVDEARQALADGSIPELQQEVGKAAFMQQLGNRMALARSEEWAKQRALGFDPTTDDADAMIRAGIEEDLADFQDNPQFIQSYLRAVDPFANKFRQGAAIENIEFLQGQANQGVYSTFLLAARTGIEEGASPDEIAAAIRAQYQGNKLSLSIPYRDQDREVLRVASTLAEEGRVEIAEALLTTPRKDDSGASLGSLAENREYASDAAKILRRAKGIREEKNRETSFEDRYTFITQAREGKLDEEQLLQYHRANPGAFSDAQVAALTAQNTGEYERAQAKSAAIASFDDRVRFFDAARIGQLNREELIAFHKANPEVFTDSQVLTLIQGSEAEVQKLRAEALSQDSFEFRIGLVDRAAKGDLSREEILQLRKDQPEVISERFATSLMSANQDALAALRSQELKGAEAALTAELFDTRQRFYDEALAGSLNRQELRKFMKDYPGQLSEAQFRQLVNGNTSAIKAQKAEEERQAALAAKAAQEEALLDAYNRQETRIDTSLMQAGTDGRLAFLSPQEAITRTGTQTSLSVKEQQDRAVSLYLNQNARLAQTQGDEAAFADAIEWFGRNGLVNPQWKQVLAQGITGATGPALANDKVPPATSGGLELYRQLRASNPQLLAKHVDEASRDFYEAARIAQDYAGQDEGKALATATIATRDPDAAARVDNKAIDAAVRSMDGWFSKVENRSQMATEVRRAATFYAKQGLPVDVAIEQATERVEQTHTDINGWMVYTADRRVPPQFPTMVEDYLDLFTERHGEEHDFDAADLTIRPVQNSTSMWQIVEKDTGLPAGDGRSGVFTLSTLDQARVLREQRKVEKVIADQAEVQDYEAQKAEEREAGRTAPLDAPPLTRPEPAPRAAPSINDDNAQRETTSPRRPARRRRGPAYD